MTLVIGPDYSAFYVDDVTLEPTSNVFYAPNARDYDIPDVRKISYTEWKKEKNL